MYRDIIAAAGGATTANTILGRAVLSVTGGYRAQAAAARVTAQQEIQSAMQATATHENARRAHTRAIQNRRIVTQGALRAERDGWNAVAIRIRGLRTEYMQLGASAEQAEAMQLQAARAAQRGQIMLAQQIMSTQRAHMAAAATATVSATTSVTAIGRLTAAVVVLRTALWTLMGGWLGLIAAVGYGSYKLFEYMLDSEKLSRLRSPQIARDKRGLLLMENYLS